LEARARGIIESESDPLFCIPEKEPMAFRSMAKVAAHSFSSSTGNKSLWQKERAFRKRFDWSGDGSCLNDEDIEVLQSGFHRDLPNG
jgi:hypothetical protein